MVRDYGRKPYIKGKDSSYKNTIRGGGTKGSYRQMMKRIPDSQTNRNEKHSEFKKPYHHDDYSAMEHFQDPKQYDGSTGVGTPASPEGWCHFWIILGGNYGYVDKIKCQVVMVLEPSSTWRASHGLTRSRIGFHIGMESLYLFFNVNIGDKFEFTLVENVCNYTFLTPWKKTIKCSDCKDSFNQLEYDYDNSDETVVREATADIYITGGMAPYSWVESGTDFDLGSATTSDGTNTISAGASACGSGTITVTDDCGKTATGYIRCTTGQWVWVEGPGLIDCGEITGYTEIVTSPPGNIKDVISGKNKYRYYSYEYLCCLGCDPGPPITGTCGTKAAPEICCVEFILGYELNRCTGTYGCGVDDVDEYSIWNSYDKYEWQC